MPVKTFERPMGQGMTIAPERANKILVTGGCGFLGSHVCELFKERGWSVLAYDSLTKFEYSRAFENVERIRDYNLRYLESIGVPTIIDDISNIKMLRKAVNGCNLVAHCAAQPAMTIAIEDPVLDFQANVLGTLGLLEICRERKVPIANCSTIHVYGSDLNQHLEEHETRFIFKFGEGISEDYFPLLRGTTSPLHASKRAAELYVQAYIDTYNLPAANFRLTGIYGPRQFGGEDHGWVANFAIRTLLEQPIKIFGTDKQVRDILYVKDAANAFLKWHEHDCKSGTYNIGGGRHYATSIRELLSLLKQLTGKESPIEWLPERRGDLWWFVSDCTKASKDFNWRPSCTPTEGLWQLVRWIEDERSILE